MPSTVSGLFDAAGVVRFGAVQWGTLVPVSGPGVYLVSLHQDPDSVDGRAFAVSSTAIRRLLTVRPEATVDGFQVTEKWVADRLAAIWLPDEVVLYIGKATHLRTRVKQYYDTPIGARSPHAGGWPIKMVDCLNTFWVHYAQCANPEEIEERLIEAFLRAVSSTTRAGLIDPDRPYPYANLTGPGGRKKHGIEGAKQERGRPSPANPTSKPPNSAKQVAVAPPPRSASQGGYVTQPITGPDIAAGRIRIPRTSKRAFPREKGLICLIDPRNERRSARWDPRFGPPERSGVIGIGKAALTDIAPGTVMTIHIDGECYVLRRQLRGA